MKKVLMIMLLILVILTACDSSKIGNAQFAEAVTLLEKNEQLLYNLEIAYTDYKKNIKDIVTEDFIK